MAAPPAPPGDSRGGPLVTDRPTAENPTAMKFVANGTRQQRQAALRRALKDARRRRDTASVRLLVRWLSDEAAA